MKEVETLVQVLSSLSEVKEALQQYSCEGVKNTSDVYYYDPLRKQFQKKEDNYPTEWLRVRQKGETAYITYKKDRFDSHGQRLYSDEQEMIIPDATTMKTLLQTLGLKELITVNVIKHIYHTQEYEIVLEEVDTLGLFLEIEKKNVGADADIPAIKKEIQYFIDNDLGALSFKPVSLGKPELLLQKRDSN